MELVIGAIVLVVAAAAFWWALPQDGHVRSFLRSEQTQAYYTVAVLLGLVISVVTIIRGLMALAA
jgi:hypothetical protein